MFDKYQDLCYNKTKMGNQQPSKIFLRDFKWKYFEGSTTNCSNECYETGDSDISDEDIV